MGHTDFDNGLGCKFDEDSPPLSSILQHSPFPPHTSTSPYYPVSMLSVANRSQGMPGIQVKGELWKFFNLIIC